MKVYLFGNEDHPQDNYSFRAVEHLKTMVGDESSVYNNIDFEIVKPNQDLPFNENENIILMDTVEGIDKTVLLDDKSIDKLVNSPRTSVHDFDLGFQLKYLKKLGKIGNVSIIGLPKDKDIDYLTIHSIFKKLVAQDIQGS